MNTCEGCGRSIQEAAEWTVHVAVYKWTMTSVDHYKLSSQKNLNIHILIWTAITMATDEALKHLGIKHLMISYVNGIITSN